MSEALGLIFDLDGTLIDSAPDIHATANKVFAARGIGSFDFATVRGFIGNGVGVLVSRLLEAKGLPGAGAQHEDLVAEFIRNYEEAVDLTSVYPGVLGALEELGFRGHPMAICTNKPESPALAVLRTFGLDRHFPVIVGGDSLAERKPHPAPLLAAKARLGLRRVLFVGDSEVDAETAVAADIPFALFTEGYRKAAVQTLGATVVFSDYGALPGLIRRLDVTS